MELHIFRTDIKSKKKLKSIKPVLNNHTDILTWSIDLEDIDNVLRVEARTNLSEEEVINLVQVKGFYIETMAD